MSCECDEDCECGCGVKVGQEVPAFGGKAVVGQQIVELSYEKGVLKVGDRTQKGRYTVLFFYPLDFTFVCPTEIIAFHEKLGEFEKLGVNVVGASVDSHYTHLAWRNTPRKQGGLGEIGFPLLSDLSRNASQAFGVLLDSGVAARGTFIIDDKGLLQSSTVNNLGVGRNVDEVLRTIEAFQFVAKHGEVCPANWHKGAATMKPDPEGSKAYFDKVQ